MFGKKNKEGIWFKTARKLNRKGKLSSPYSALLKYYEAVAYTHGVLIGHFDFFSTSKFFDELDGYVKDLRAILPPNLLENFNAALEKFVSLGEDPEYEEIESAFDEYDEYAAEHAEEIAELLESYISEMEERHYL